MDNRYEEFIQDVLINIHENIAELKQRKVFADPDELTYIEAKLAAYHELLAMLGMSADQFNIPRGELGL